MSDSEQVTTTNDELILECECLFKKKDFIPLQTELNLICNDNSILDCECIVSHYNEIKLDTELSFSPSISLNSELLFKSINNEYNLSSEVLYKSTNNTSELICEMNLIFNYIIFADIEVAWQSQLDSELQLAFNDVESKLDCELDLRLANILPSELNLGFRSQKSLYSELDFYFKEEMILDSSMSLIFENSIPCEIIALPSLNCELILSFENVTSELDSEFYLQFNKSMSLPSEMNIRFENVKSELPCELIPLFEDKLDSELTLEFVQVLPCELLYKIPRSKSLDSELIVQINSKLPISCELELTFDGEESLPVELIVDPNGMICYLTIIKELQ